MTESHASHQGACPRCKGPTIVQTVTARHLPGGKTPMEVCANERCFWPGRDLMPAPVTR